MATRFAQPLFRASQKNEVIRYARNPEGSREAGRAKINCRNTFVETFLLFRKDPTAVDPL